MFPALLRAPRSINIPRTRQLLSAVGFCFLLAALALPTVLSLVQSWRRNPDYEYAWVLTPVVIWLFYRAKPWCHAEQPARSLGMLTLMMGGVLHLAAQVITWPLFD